MSSLMVRPSSRITSCTCSAISGGRENVIVLVFPVDDLLIHKLSYSLFMGHPLARCQWGLCSAARCISPPAGVA